MSHDHPLTFLCLAGYEKGFEFLQELKKEGCRVVFLTTQALANAAWPKDSIDEMFLMPDVHKHPDILHGVSYMARNRVFDRVVALDDYDVETAATIREHLRIPGMGDTTARYFRDKLAMRVRARNRGILVPEFVHVLNHDQMREYMDRVKPPWVVKPRSEASAVGIRKIHEPDQLWRLLEELGDRQSYFVMEKFVPGDVYHVDGVVNHREVLFAEAHRYGDPPMKVAHDGGIFTTQTLLRGTSEERDLLEANRKLVDTLGLVRGVTHTEFIKAEEDGRFYFLETAARVGGAHIADMVEAASGLNLWREWARIEIAGADRPYTLPRVHKKYSGILISLARQKTPDLSGYQDPEITFRLQKDHHAGLILASEDHQRVTDLLDQYRSRFMHDFYAYAPLPDKPSH